MEHALRVFHGGQAVCEYLTHGLDKTDAVFTLEGALGDPIHGSDGDFDRVWGNLAGFEFRGPGKIPCGPADHLVGLFGGDKAQDVLSHHTGGIRRCGVATGLPGNLQIPGQVLQNFMETVDLTLGEPMVLIGNLIRLHTGAVEQTPHIDMGIPVFDQLDIRINDAAVVKRFVSLRRAARHSAVLLLEANELEQSLEVSEVMIGVLCLHNPQIVQFLYRDGHVLSAFVRVHHHRNLFLSVQIRNQLQGILEHHTGDGGWIEDDHTERTRQVGKIEADIGDIGENDRCKSAVLFLTKTYDALAEARDVHIH